MREYQALNEDNFQSSWLRKDVEGIEERRKEMDKQATEEESSSGKREVEREEESTCNFEDLCSVEVLGELGFLGESSCGGLGGSSVCGSAGSLAVSGVCVGIYVFPWSVGEREEALFSVSEVTAVLFFL